MKKLLLLALLLFPSHCLAGYYDLQHGPLISKSTSEITNEMTLRGDFSLVYDTYTPHLHDMTKNVVLYGTGTIRGVRFEGSGIGLTNIPASSINGGSLGASVITSSIAVNAVYPETVRSGTYSNITLPAANVAVGELQSGVTAQYAIKAGTLDNITQITARSHTNLTDIGTKSHATIDSQLDSVGASTATLRTDLTTLQVSTPTIGVNVQAYDADLDDLADGSLTGSKVGSGVPAANIAAGSLGASVIASSIAVNSVHLDAIQGTGTRDSTTFYRGDGTFATPSGAGDAVLSATQTWTGTNTFSQITYGIVPTGSVIMYVSSSTMPTGFLYCNGAAVSTTTYSALFSIIGYKFGNPGGGNMNLPDMRGMFVRGIDNGRGLDPEAFRVVGSTQTDTMQGHTFTTNAQTSTLAGAAGGAVGVNSGSAATITGPVTDGVNGTPRTSNETRPENIGMVYIIKY